LAHEPHSLDALTADPSLVGKLSAEARAQIVARCAALVLSILAAPIPEHHVNGDDPILTVAEAAARLKYARGHLYELIKNKALAAVRHGRSFRIRTSEIERFLNESDTRRGDEIRVRNGARVKRLVPLR
jgi:excisionase family DNA binding protein